VRTKRLLNGHAATAVIAGAVGAALATAGIAAGGAVLSADGPGSAARVCVDVNDNVRFHGTGACLAGETALDLAKPIPTGMADALAANSAKDEAAAEKIAKKARKLKRSIGSSGNAAAQKLAFLESRSNQILRAVATLAELSRRSHETSNSIIQNVRG
jgi:hypothetical protein